MQMFVDADITAAKMPRYPVFEKACATTQTNVQSPVFWILKKT